MFVLTCTVIVSYSGSYFFLKSTVSIFYLKAFITEFYISIINFKMKKKSLNKKYKSNNFTIVTSKKLDNVKQKTLQYLIF